MQLANGANALAATAGAFGLAARQRTEEGRRVPMPGTASRGRPLVRMDRKTHRRTSSTIRVMVADDSALMRVGLMAMLESHPRLSVVSVAVDGREAVRKAVDLAPDLVVLDFRMPRLNGLEAAREIRRRLPEVKIIIVSMHDLETFGSTEEAASVDAIVSKMHIRERLAGLIETLFPS